MTDNNPYFPNFVEIEEALKEFNDRNKEEKFIASFRSDSSGRNALSVFAFDKNHAVACWWTMYKNKPEDTEYNCYGGIESHYKPKRKKDTSHSICFVLGQPCCHEGSSLMFEEAYKDDIMFKYYRGILSRLKILVMEGWGKP